MPSEAGEQRRRPTMNDVARLSGVSLKSVSRVINGESGASAETQHLVRAAIRELGYQRNDTAHTLRRRDRRSACLGLVVDDVGNPFAAALNRGLEQFAAAQGSLVLAASTNGDPEAELQIVRRLLARTVDGLVITSSRTDHSYLAPDVERGVPIVFVDRPAHGIAAPSVLAANREGARAAVEHLIAHGHRQIAFLGDWPNLYTTAERHHGYVDAHLRHDLTVPTDLDRFGLVDNASARDAITALFDRQRPPTAIFAANNLTCIRVLQALHRSRLMGKVTVVGFDDIELANLLHPPVSVVRQDPAAMGQLAAQIIFAELAGQRSTPREVFVPVTLVPRGALRTPAPDSAPRVHRT